MCCWQAFGGKTNSHGPTAPSCILLTYDGGLSTTLSADENIFLVELCAIGLSPYLWSEKWGWPIHQICPQNSIAVSWELGWPLAQFLSHTKTHTPAIGFVCVFKRQQQQKLSQQPNHHLCIFPSGLDHCLWVEWGWNSSCPKQEGGEYLKKKFTTGLFLGCGVGMGKFGFCQFLLFSSLKFNYVYIRMSLQKK